MCPTVVDVCIHGCGTYRNPHHQLQTGREPPSLLKRNCWLHDADGHISWCNSATGVLKGSLATTFNRVKLSGDIKWRRRADKVWLLGVEKHIHGPRTRMGDVRLDILRESVACFNGIPALYDAVMEAFCLFGNGRCWVHFYEKKQEKTCESGLILGVIEGRRPEECLVGRLNGDTMTALAMSLEWILEVVSTESKIKRERVITLGHVQYFTSTQLRFCLGVFRRHEAAGSTERTRMNIKCHFMYSR